MSEAALEPLAPSDEHPRRRLARTVAWLVGILALLVALRIAGVDVWGWLEQLWETVTDISFVYIVLGCLFQALQTTLTALGWYGILRYAYPGGVTYMEVLASYAVGVALNNYVPANMGTFVMLLMFVAVVRGAEVVASPRPDFVFRAGDVIVVIGTADGTAAVAAILADG